VSLKDLIRLGVLHNFFTGKCGGSYVATTELLSQLEKMGVIIKVFTTSAIAQTGRERTEFFEKKSNNYTIFRFHSYLKFREYRISLKMIPFLLKNAKDIDIFHSNAIRSYQEDIGSFVSIIKKKPLVITPHGAIAINWDFSDKIPKMLYDKSLGYLKRKLLNPHFIAVGKNEIPIIKKYGVDDDHIHHIPNGVNTEIFKPVDSSNLKKKYNLEGFDIILYVGRIAKGKGVDILLEILHFIIKKRKNVKLLIVGDDSGYFPVVKDLIQKYNLAKYVIFPGYISKNRLPEYYSIADLFVYPSRQEIFGLTLVEAGACGKAVIGSDIMGPSEIIIDGKTGFTSDFKDPSKLSELIIELLNDKDRLVKMGKNGQELVKSKYSWKRTAELHLNLYKKLL
jgi:glycosyltransferase involved in cell wall biosynthesis